MFLKTYLNREEEKIIGGHMCLDVIKNPVKALEAAKKERSMTKSVVTALVTSVIFAIGVALTSVMTLPIMTTATFAGIFFLFALVAILFSGLIIELSANVLGGKGQFFEGMTVAASSGMLLSIGFLISSIFSLVPYGVVVSVIAFGVFLALSLSTLLRGIKELFKTDMMTSFLVFIVLMVTLLVAMYFGGGTGLIDMGNIIPVV
jgi:hypothetical protein